jgi:ATP-dependent helicase/nuclease subunit A
MPADDAARVAIRTDLRSSLFVEAGAGAGKTRELVERIVGLVATGVPLPAVAAITFTEKAASELRDRVRSALEDRLEQRLEALPELASRYREALVDLDSAHIQTIHSFARDLLAEFPGPAGLPARFDVVDPAVAAMQFETRWARFVDDAFSGEEDGELWTLAYALGATADRLRDLAVQFHDHWDQLNDPEPWMVAAGDPDLDVSGALRALDDLLAARSGCKDPDDKLFVYLEQTVAPWRETLAGGEPTEVVALLQRERPKVSNGKTANWVGPTKAEVGELAVAASEAFASAYRAAATPVLAFVCRELRRWTLEGAAGRAKAGRLEFHDLLVRTRDLLASSPEVLAAVRGRLSYLLVDEFQDTDPLQAELATEIAGGRPGALFVVGDPKQSIYRFRQADLVVYEALRERWEGERVELTTNFRSVAPVLAWCNQAFEPLLGDAWAPLQGSRTELPDGAVRVLGGPVPAPAPAGAVRALEAEEVAAACRAAIAQEWSVSDRVVGGVRPARYDDIAVLLPTRASLPALERALDAAGVPYRVESRSLIWSTQDVRDLLAVLRAIDDPSDEVAIVTALRSPLLACDDRALVTWRGAGRAWRPTDGLDLEHPVNQGLMRLAGWRSRRWALGPEEMVAAVVAETDAFALAYGKRRQRESWHRLRFVLDQARAFADRGGQSLRGFLDWADRQTDERVLGVESAAPEPDDRAVRILTVHAAKGLEFGICVVSGLGTAPFRARSARAVWSLDGLAVRLGPKDFRWESPGFPDSFAEEVQLEADEQLRVLYVACTRARDHLVVSAWHPAVGTLRADSCLAARLWDRLADELRAGWSPPAPADVVAGPAGPFDPAWDDVDAWVARRDARIAEAAAGVTSVSALIEDPAGAPRPAGVGGFGAAFGRAVHGVLEEVDLGGDDVDRLAGRLAAAEGVDPVPVAAAVRSALAAPVVAEARRAGRVWREVPVAGVVDGRVVDGTIDLLFETPAGLVVVDYKTDADPQRSLDHHRRQLGAYGSLVAQAGGPAVARLVLLFLRADGYEEVVVSGSG